MNPASVRSRLGSIIRNGLPVICKYHGIPLTGSFTSANEEVLMLEYGTIEQYQRSIIFPADAFPAPPKRDELVIVDGVPLYVLGCREEPGISITVDLRK